MGNIKKGKRSIYSNVPTQLLSGREVSVGILNSAES